jgi:hypothetical protein
MAKTTFSRMTFRVFTLLQNATLAVQDRTSYTLEMGLGRGF